MLAISRFRYPADGGDVRRPTAELGQCLEALRARPGFLDGHVARALDDPELWVLETHWADVGSYRRALSSYDVKMTAVPLLAQALDEPSAFEIVLGEGATSPNVVRPRGTVP